MNNKRTTNENEIVKCFRAYREFDVSVVPLKIDYVNGKKIPHFQPGWPTNYYTEADIAPDMNALALKTGAISNLMVIDFDMPESVLETFFEQNQVLYQMFFRVSTPSGGMHLYLDDSHRDYWCKKYGRKSLTTTNPYLKIDVRHDGACVFSPPTSIAGYGDYVWIDDSSIEMSLKYNIWDIEYLMDIIYSYNPSNRRTIRQRKRTSVPQGDRLDLENASICMDKLYTMEIDYSSWIKLGLSLKRGFGDSGKNLWRLFAQNPNYNDTVQDLDKIWENFEPVFVSLNSFFGLAKDLGATYRKGE